MADLRASLEIKAIDSATPAVKRVVAATERLNHAQLQTARATQVVAANELEAANAAIQNASNAQELAAAQLRAARATERLAKAQIAELRASERLAKAQLAETAAAERVAASQREASVATEQVAAASAPAKQGLFGVTDAAKKQGFAMAGQVNAVSELAFNFGNLSPMTRNLGMAFVMAGGNAFAFAGMLGPLGVVLGVMVGILPGIIDFTRRLGEEMENTGAAAADAAKEFTGLIDARLEEARVRQRIRDIDTGEAPSEDIATAIDLNEEEAAAGRRRAAAARIGVDQQGRARGKTDILGDLLDEDTRSGFFDAVGGLVTGGFEGVREAQRQNLADAAREQATANRRRQNALPLALAREEQEALERRASEAASRQSVAQRELERRLDAAGVAGSRRQAITQAATSGARVELPSLVRGLPEDQRGAVLGASRLTADAAALAEQTRREADAAEVRALEEQRRVERARGNELGNVTIDSRGSGAGGGQRAELVTARSGAAGDPEARRILEQQLAEQRAQTRQTQRLIDELARSTGGAASRGPDTLGAD